MITNAEKKIIHIYADYAGVDGPAYRDLLHHKTGKTSSADPGFTHQDVDQVLAAIETILWQRVHQGLLDDPGRAGHRYIREEFHFRRKCQGPAFINSRQAHMIEDLWRQLCDYLPPEERTNSYLHGIMSRATGRHDIGQGPLRKSEAASVIDALADRIRYAIRQPVHDEVPF